MVCTVAFVSEKRECNCILFRKCLASNRLTFSASVKLSPHGNMPVPSPRMDLNVLTLDSREQSVPYDAVLIPVRGKILKQKRIPFNVSYKRC